jgi:hypothetical protein
VVVPLDPLLEQEAEGGLAAALVAEDDGGARLLGLAEDLLEVRVRRLSLAEAHEHRIVPGFLSPEWILADLPVAPEFIDLHRLLPSIRESPAARPVAAPGVRH